MKPRSTSSAPKRTPAPRRPTASRPVRPETTSRIETSKPGGARSPRDKVELSRGEEPPRSGFVNPLDTMFSVSATSSESGRTADAHAAGALSEGRYDVGAGAESWSRRQSVTAAGHTVHRESESKEAHVRVNASGELLDGKFRSEVDLGASGRHDESRLSRKETGMGGVRLAAEAGAAVGVDARAGLYSRTETDLANGRLDQQSGGVVGIETAVRAHGASEVEAFGVTRRDEVAAGAGVKAKAEAQRRLKIDENGVDASQSASAEAKVAADVTAATRYSTDAGSIEGKLRGEASVFAEAHAGSHFKLTEDELSFGARAGAGAAAQLQAEGTLQAETRNGSRFRLNGGANTGSVGAGAGFEVSRKKGQTSLGFESSGGLAAVGGHLNGSMTVADRDVAETAAAPIAAGGLTYQRIGDGAAALSHTTESMRRAAHQRQDFIGEMGAVPTGNLLADTGIAAAQKLHGVYTGTVDFADTFAEEATGAYRRAGEELNSRAVRVADLMEENLGQALDRGVKKAHQGYQYGRAVGGGFVQGLGQGAYNITSLGGLLY